LFRSRTCTPLRAPPGSLATLSRAVEDIEAHHRNSLTCSSKTIVLMSRFSRPSSVWSLLGGLTKSDVAIDASLALSKHCHFRAITAEYIVVSWELERWRHHERYDPIKHVLRESRQHTLSASHPQHAGQSSRTCFHLQALMKCVPICSSTCGVIVKMARALRESR
jgi:hypothetical protein